MRKKIFKNLILNLINILSLASFLFRLDPEASSVIYEEQRGFEKSSNSSIGGNYESVIGYLNNHFIERKALLMNVYKE